METNTTSTNTTSLRGRLMRGLGATALGPVITAIIQLGPVPLLLHTWGPAKYGDWLLLSAIPAYLTLSDAGFGDASGSDMSMRVAANDRQGALETFQSSWVLVTSVSFAIWLIASVSVWWIPWSHWLKLSSISDVQAAAITLVLAAHVVVAQQNGVTESGYRCDGNFATGMFWIIMQRLVEALVACCVALLGGNLLSVALTYLGVRAASSVGYAVLLRRRSPWLHFGIRHARLARIKMLAGPAFGFMAFPVGQALSLQGFMIVIGSMLGPVAVVAFSTLRTLSRLNFQLMNVIGLSIGPELSKAFGSRDIPLARKLHRHACQAALGFSVSGAFLLWICGPFVYRLWLHGAVSFDALCFHVLLLVIVANSLWYTSSAIPMSTNVHRSIAAVYMAATAVSLALAWVLTRSFGIVGAALALLSIDLWMTWLVLPVALKQVQDTLQKFVVAVFTVLPLGRSLQATPEA